MAVPMSANDPSAGNGNITMSTIAIVIFVAIGLVIDAIE